ncbi:FkbM family methyltransferase [Methylobacillus pratensis]
MRHPSKIHSLEKIKKIGMPIGTVLDVGVLTRTPELIEAFPDLHHLLFEPYSGWNDRIAHHYRDLSHEILNIAVSDQDGTATLELRSVNPDYEVTHTGIVQEPGSGRESITVPMSRLDTVLADRQALPGPYLLKIDVDGHEMAILQGAEQTLKQCSVVVIEAAIGSLMERAKVLESAGFTLFDIVDICYYDDYLWQVDLVFLNTQMMLENQCGLQHIQQYDFVKKFQGYFPFND